METQKKPGMQSSGVRNGMVSLVKGGGICCLFGMIVGSFLPLFAMGDINFVKVLWGLIGAAEDDFVQGVMGLFGYNNIEFMAWGIVIGIIVLYLLEWKAFRRVLDYPVYRGYGWNIWLLLSSAAGAICFYKAVDWLDFGWRGDAAGSGLMVLQWSHIILVVLSVMAIIVKCNYNGEQRRRKMEAQVQTEIVPTFAGSAGTIVMQAPGTPVRATAASIQSMGSGKVCAKCGQPLADGAMFCAACGEKVTGTLTCKSCGRERAGEEKFCTRCGMRFEME